MATHAASVESLRAKLSPYELEDKVRERIVTFVQRAAEGKQGELPLIVIGGPRTGKSTLSSLVMKLFPDLVQLGASGEPESKNNLFMFLDKVPTKTEMKNYAKDSKNVWVNCMESPTWLADVDAQVIKLEKRWSK